MASRKYISKLIMAIKTIYPYYAKDNDVGLLTETWEALLKEYDDEIVKPALYRALQTCKMPPTPADIIEHIKAIAQENGPSAAELWAVYQKALKDTAKYVYRIQYPYPGENPRMKIREIWNGLPQAVKDYIGSEGEMIRLSDYGDTDTKYDKNNFMKAMPELIKSNYAQSTVLIGNTERKGLKEGK